MNELYLNTKNNITEYAIYSDEEPVYIGAFDACKIHTGDVFYGQAREYQKGINATFVDIGDERTAFVPDMKLRNGEYYIFQVVSEAHDGKGAEVSDEISFTNKYSVIKFSKRFENNLSFSKKILSNEIKDYLSNKIIINSINGYNISLKIRTAFDDICHYEDLLDEIEKVKTLFGNISKHVDSSVKCVYKLSLCDYINSKFHISNFDKIHEDREMSFYSEINRLSEYKKSVIRQKSGSWIKIEKTEALIVIDVNSGSSKKTPLEINKDATIDILRALKINNYSGIIIIDYINLTKAERQDLIEYFVSFAKNDYAFCHPLGFTKLGLLEVQRSRV